MDPKRRALLAAGAAAAATTAVPRVFALQPGAASGGASRIRRGSAQAMSTPATACRWGKA